MNTVDMIIIVFIIIGALLGFKRGFSKQLVKGCGFVIVVVLAYLLKNPLSILMYEHLPFWNLGIMRNIQILNILFYEFIAFLLCLAIFGILLKILLLASALFERILNATVILGIPSKIGGAVVGALTHYIAAFMIIYIFTMPFFNINLLKDSEYANKILDKTPILSGIADDTVAVANEFYNIKLEYEKVGLNNEELDKLNYDTIELFLKYDIIKSESLEKLIDSGKMNAFDGYMDLLTKYKGEK